MGELLSAVMLWKTGIVVVWFAGFLLAERLHPAAVVPADAGLLRRATRHGGLLVLNTVLTVWLVSPLTLWSSDHALLWHPDWFAGWPLLVLGVFALDLAAYWSHRVSHMVPLLWRFHEIHHLDDTLDTTSALRFHGLDVIWTALWSGAVVLLLGLPLSVLLVYETAVLLCSIYHHSNATLPVWTERLFAPLIVTPGIHWVHHHKIRRDTDSNYGALFSIWDRLFGSFSKTKRTPDMAIGVEGLPDTDFAGLFLRPFRAARDRDRAF
jgi:sterol desaturase/sphingolipid hydroxylase (fatty acid hydroxylase superfamily)